MKVYILIFWIILLRCTLAGQTYKGTSSDKVNGYQCTLRINADSSINYIYYLNENSIYAEFKGFIKKVNDSLFHISAEMSSGQFCMKSWDTDSFYIQIDTPIAYSLDKIQFEYSDKSIQQFQGYDRAGRAIRLLKIPVDKNKLNYKPGSNFIIITINRKNQITDELLSFKIPYGSGASFTNGRKEEFDLIIKKGLVYTIGDPPDQTGHFKLEAK